MVGRFADHDLLATVRHRATGASTAQLVIADETHSAQRGYILTGAPGAGKTAGLRLLEINGHVVVEEAATLSLAARNPGAPTLSWSRVRG